MARGIDLSSLTRAERAVLLSGLLLFVDGLVPWWYRVSTAEGTFSYNAGLTGWGLVAVLAGAAAALAVTMRAAIWPEPAPVRDGLLYTSLGILATVAIAIQLARSDAGWIGIYVALFLAIGLTVAGLRRRLERRAGWT